MSAYDLKRLVKLWLREELTVAQATARLGGEGGGRIGSTDFEMSPLPK